MYNVTFDNCYYVVESHVYVFWICFYEYICNVMTSSNGNIFQVTGHLCGDSPVIGEFPAHRPVTRSFDVFFDHVDLRPNKRLSKQSWGWWLETPFCPLWRHYNENVGILIYEWLRNNTFRQYRWISYIYRFKSCWWIYQVPHLHEFGPWFGTGLYLQMCSVWIEKARSQYLTSKGGGIQFSGDYMFNKQPTTNLK